MDELKNLVIQTLETNGILGQLRAQLRSCVFKVIDNQDTIEKGQSGFHWENPNARKVMQHASGVICAELVKEFLEFNKLDYTLAIFMPEVNLTAQNSMSKEELSRKVGLSDPSPNKPIMAQLVESFLSNDRPVSSMSSNKQKAEEKSLNAQISQHKAAAAPSNYALPDTYANKYDNSKNNNSDSSGNNSHSSSRDNVADISKNSVKSASNVNTYQQPPKQEEKSITDSHLERANRMLEEHKREEKSGYQFAPTNDNNNNKSGKYSKREDDLIDTYGDDFEEEIEEDLPDDTNHLLDSNDGGNHKGITESAGGITVSQSLGVDPSVDSLALEDYDHIEPVERLS